MNIWDLPTMAIEPHQPVILHSDEGAARVIAIRLPAGEALGDHEVHEHAWLGVHQGVVEVGGGEAARRVTTGSFVHWPPHERHEVHAIEDALLVLILAPWPGAGHSRLTYHVDAGEQHA
jgi:quercetin dioxygenase-like cupin family protein